MKSSSDQDVFACHVALSVNSKLFFEVLCRKLFSPLYKSEISLLNEENQFVPIKDYSNKTLEELGIQENSILRIDFNRDEVSQTSDPIRDVNTTNRTENIQYEEFIGNSVGRAVGSDEPIPLPSKLNDFLASLMFGYQLQPRIIRKSPRIMQLLQKRVHYIMNIVVELYLTYHIRVGDRS